MTIRTIFAHERYLNSGLSTDTKPAGQTPLSEFYEYDTFRNYMTYDGTNWVLKVDEVNPFQIVRILHPFGKGTLTAGGAQYSTLVTGIATTYTTLETVTINQ